MKHIGQHLCMLCQWYRPTDISQALPYIVQTMQQHCSTAMTWYYVVLKLILMGLADDSLNASVLQKCVFESRQDKKSEKVSAKYTDV